VGGSGPGHPGVRVPTSSAGGSGRGLLPPGGPRSILVVMMSAVGDAVQVLPVLNALKRSFPACRISWLIQPGPHALLRDHPAVDEFILFQRGRRGRSPSVLVAGAHAIRATHRTLRDVAQRQPGGSFDLLLNLQVYFKAGVLTGLAPARVKLGFDWHRTRDLNRFFTTHRIPPHPTRFAHTQDQYLEFLRYLDIDPDPVTYGLEISGEEGEAQQAFFQQLTRPACAMVVASSSPTKDWTPEGYARVAENLYGDLGLQPILVGGHTPREVEVARKIREASHAPVLDETGNGIRRLMWLLKGSRVVISPDTGPLHMARALEVPVVGLYGTTNPKRSGPYRMFGDLVVDGYARSGEEEYALTPKRRPGGMGRITPERVLSKVGVALERYSASPSPSKESSSSTPS
jgi:heptosyltransferase I